MRCQDQWLPIEHSGTSSFQPALPEIVLLFSSKIGSTLYVTQGDVPAPPFMLLYAGTRAVSSTMSARHQTQLRTFPAAKCFDIVCFQSMVQQLEGIKLKLPAEYHWDRFLLDKFRSGCVGSRLSSLRVMSVMTPQIILFSTSNRPWPQVERIVQWHRSPRPTWPRKHQQHTKRSSPTKHLCVHRR